MGDLVKTTNPSIDQDSVRGSLIDQESVALVRNFSHLCERIEKSIAEQKVIQERTLLDFSRMSITAFRSKMNREVDAFHNLSRCISDYWHYGLKHETNLKRGYSYVRLYQMITMIHTFYADSDLEYRVHDALEANRNNVDLLARIRHTPGITHKKLCGALAATTNDLQGRLQTLEKEGYVTGQRSGEERYYVLSNAGDILYHYLTKSGQNHWVDQWSDKRILVLYFMLRSLKQNGNKAMTVQDVERMIAAFNEKVIDSLFRSIITKEKKKKPLMVRQIQAKQLDICTDIYIKESVTKVPVYQLLDNRLQPGGSKNEYIFIEVQE